MYYQKSILFLQYFTIHDIVQVIIEKAVFHMKRKLLLLPLVLILLFILPVSASAHPGGTDANGGHYEDGEYHYHHGYPAHQHTNGVCPYDSSASSSSSSEAVSAKSNKSSDRSSSYYLFISAMVFVGVLPFILMAVSVFFRRKRFSPYIFFFSALEGVPFAWGITCAFLDIDLPQIVNGIVVIAFYALLLMLFRSVWDDSSPTYGRIFRLYRIKDCPGGYFRYVSPSVNSSGCVEIEFTKDASYSNNAFRRALFEAAERYPKRIEKVRILNLCLVGGDLIDAAFPLFFDYMDFSSVCLADYPFRLDWIGELRIPAKNIVLPADIERIRLPQRMTDVLSICIPSDEVIACYLDISCSIHGWPACVNSKLKFYVPKDLVQAYETNEKWSGLDLVDESGNTYTPVFLPYCK